MKRLKYRPNKTQRQVRAKASSKWRKGRHKKVRKAGQKKTQRQYRNDSKAQRH